LSTEKRRRDAGHKELELLRWGIESDAFVGLATVWQLSLRVPLLSSALSVEVPGGEIEHIPCKPAGMECAEWVCR
jgi:hypothetical protein